MKVVLVLLIQVLFTNGLYSQSDSLKDENIQRNNPVQEYRISYSKSDYKMVPLFENILINTHNYQQSNNLNPDSTSQSNSSNNGNFFKSSLFYFLGTAAAVLTVYFVLNHRNHPANTYVTFGLPPSPK